MNQYKSERGQVRKIAFFLIAVALVFLFRSLWTYPIDHSDGLQKHLYAVEILRTGDWSLLLHDHHTMRWAVMLPQIGLTWLLGTRYEIFFILPLLMFSLYVVLIVFSLRNILNFNQLLLIGTILLTETMAFQVSNQYSVTGLGIFLIFAGILALINQGKRQNLTVAFAAVLFFMAYGAHVTYLSFSVGGALWLAFSQRKPSRAIMFCTVILVLITIETLVFNCLADWQLTLGRMEALSNGEHVHRNMTSSPVSSGVSFGQLISRWLYLPKPEILLCIVFFLAGPWLVFQKRKNKKVPEFIECTYVVGLSFAILLTFAVLSLDPIIPAMPLRIRFLIPFLPFASIIFVYVLSVFISRVLGKTFIKMETAISLIFVLFMLIWPTYQIDFFRSKFNAFIWRAEGEYVAFSEKFLKGELILTGKKKLIYPMIVQFRYPVESYDQNSGVSMSDRSPNALCVDRLDKVPLHLNYEDCAN